MYIYCLQANNVCKMLNNKLWSLDPIKVYRKRSMDALATAMLSYKKRQFGLKTFNRFPFNIKCHTGRKLEAKFIPT